MKTCKAYHFKLNKCTIFNGNTAVDGKVPDDFTDDFLKAVEAGNLDRAYLKRHTHVEDFGKCYIKYLNDQLPLQNIALQEGAEGEVNETEETKYIDFTDEFSGPQKQWPIEDAHINLDQSKPGCRDWYIQGLTSCGDLKGPADYSGKFERFHFKPCVCGNEKISLNDQEPFESKNYVDQPDSMVVDYYWRNINNG